MKKQKVVNVQNSSGFSTKQVSSKNSIDDDLHPFKQPLQQQEMGIQMLKMLQEMEKSKKLFRERILKHRQQRAAEGSNGSQKHLDDFEDDEDYWDSELYDDEEEDDIESMSIEEGEEQEDQRYIETRRKLTQNLHKIASKQENQNKEEPLIVGEFFRSCVYKLSLAIVLLGCILSLYLAYECMQGITQSSLKEHIAYQVINHHGQPSYLRSQIFTQHSYLDYPFQLYTFVDQKFATFLASGTPKNELLFSESFIPILFVPGSGKQTEDIASINHLDQKLQELVEYEISKQIRLGKISTKESKERHKIFKFFSLDFKEALSAFSIDIIEKQTIALMRAILYISTRTQEKIILICNQIGGLVCLGALEALKDEHLSQISQVIFLNSPLAKHPIDSHFDFINKYKSIYTTLSQRIQLLQPIRLLSFASEELHSEINQLNLPLRNSIFIKTLNLRDVFTNLPGDQPLTSPSFLSLLSKYFILDYYKKVFKDDDIKGIYDFFTKFDIHYEDSFDRNTFAFSRSSLDKRCGKIIPTFEKTITTDLLAQARRVKVQTSQQKTYQKQQRYDESISRNNSNNKMLSHEETEEFSYDQSFLCVKIMTSHVRASNLFYLLSTNLLSQDIKVFTFKQQKGTLLKQIPVEIHPQFSFFFSTIYLHKQSASNNEIYMIFSIKNNTLLHKEYSTFYQHQVPRDKLFLNLSNFQSSGNTLPPFIRPRKDEWQIQQQVFRAKFPDNEENGMYKYCSSSFLGTNQIAMFRSDWNRRDFNLLVLRDSITGRTIDTSFSYGERDCDYVNLHKQNKLNIKENEILFFRFTSNSSQQGNGVLTYSSNIGRYAQWMGAFLKPILLNSHASLCCILLVIQIRHFQVSGQAKVPSQLSILLHKLPSIATFEILQTLFGLTLQQSISGDENNSYEVISNAVFTSFIISLGIISTYILVQVSFQILSLGSFILCSIAKLVVFYLFPPKTLQNSPYFHFLNPHALLILLVLMTNSPIEWIAVFVIFWLILGFAQANRSLSLNILHGFGYLVLINICLNIHNIQAVLIRINTGTDFTKFRQLLAADEFTSEFFSIVCWLYVLTRVHNLVDSLGQYLQFLFAAMGILISFHTFHSVAYVNEYLCNFSYLLMLFSLFYRSSKENNNNQVNQQIKPV